MGLLYQCSQCFQIHRASNRYILSCPQASAAKSPAAVWTHWQGHQGLFEEKQCRELKSLPNTKRWGWDADAPSTDVMVPAPSHGKH